MKILMVSSECSLFAKVGGLADVVYELSVELAKTGCEINVIIPKYGIINNDFDFVNSFDIEFGNKKYKYKLFLIKKFGVNFYFIDNKSFFDGKYKDIYINSANRGNGPFEDDALRFSFFSVAVLNLLNEYESFKNIDVIHCHDWHTGSIFPLLKWDSRFSNIKVKTVFTIHNLNYQGIRPFENYNDNNTLSSFRSWFGDLYNEIVVRNNLKYISYPSNIFEIDKNIYNRLIQDWRLDSTRMKYIKDIYEQKGDKYIVKEITSVIERELYDIYQFLNILCFNPMRAGINLADYITTVSETYAKEIKLPNDDKKQIIRGCELDGDLRKKDNIKGIINGILYNENGLYNLDEPFILDADPIIMKTKNKEFFYHNIDKILISAKRKIKNNFKNYSTVINKIKKTNFSEYNDKPLFVMVSRMTEQKIDMILKNRFFKKLEDLDCFFIFVGSGNLENKMNELNGIKNILYINAFEKILGIWIYLIGDFFLMPSTYEPCGISQLVSMSYGTIPIVSDVGGLHDTIQDGETGFVFTFYNNENYQDDILRILNRSIDMFNSDKKSYQKMVNNCLKQRFDWKKSSEEYFSLYKSLTVNNL